MNHSLVLVFNCGSSSIKFAVIDATTSQQPITGLVEKIHSAGTSLSWKIHNQKHQQPIDGADYQQAMNAIFKVIEQQPHIEKQLIAVGHRVVHGGEDFTHSVIIDKPVLQTIKRSIKLAPLHNPANIIGIETCQQRYQTLSQVAVFDTAFHQTMDPISYLYSIPYELYENHKIRRYGFHGTSHRYVSQQAAKQLHQPLTHTAFITAHLGNGCSATAILNGKSVDTTMGLTPLEGLTMGSRCGNVDPGLHYYLCHELNYTIGEVNDLLNKQSGLLGISGISMDMRALDQAAQQGQSRAQLAIDIFVYHLAKQIAALMVPLGKLDALIFTGGIGENSADIRAKTLKKLAYLNFKIEQTHNENHGQNNHGIITTQDSTKAMVIPTQEEWMIAQDTLELIGES